MIAEPTKRPTIIPPTAASVTARRLVVMLPMSGRLTKLTNRLPTPISAIR
jgi:hypothetical protein